MKKIERIMRALLFLTIALILFGCGSGAKTDPYSDAMRAAAEAGSWGAGDKIAVYDVDRDAYVKRYLDEEVLPKTPEEVGAVLRVSVQDSDNTLFVLTDARDGTEIKRNVISSKKLRDEEKSGVWQSAQSWARNAWNSYCESRAIKEHLASDQALSCQKLAIYDPEADRFALAGSDRTGNYLPDSCAAHTTEEVGLYLSVKKSGTEGEQVALYDASGKIIAEPSDGIYTSDWLETEVSAYLFDREFTRPLEKVPLGGGDKFVVFNEEKGRYESILLPEGTAKGRYSDIRLPEDLTAASPGEVALIARVSRGQHTEKEMYSLFGFSSGGTLVEVNIEDVTVILTDPLTDKIFSEGTISAKAPSSVGQGAKTVSSGVTDEQMEEYFRSELKAFLLDRDFHSRMETTPLGGGDKFIVFDAEADRYEDVLLPEDLVAASPEEVGLIACISRDRHTQTERYSQGGIYGFGGHSVEVSIEDVTVTLKDPLTDEVFVEAIISARPPSSVSQSADTASSDVTDKQMESFFRSEMKAFLFDRAFHLQLETTPMGGGKKLVTFDPDTGQYSNAFIPEDLLADSPAETALVLRLTFGQETKKQRYSLTGLFGGDEVKINLETVTAKLLNPKNNAVVATKTVKAEIPQKVSMNTKEVYVQVDPEQLEEWLRAQLAKYIK